MRRPLWPRVRRGLWALRFLPLQAAIVAAVIWALLPLREAMTLPEPPLPSFTPEPPDLQETVVLGATTFAPGAPGAVRVVVYDPRSGRPLPDVDVRVALIVGNGPSAGAADGLELYAGRTDAHGTADVRFQMPDEVEGDGSLVVDTAGPVGTQRVIWPIVVRSDVDLSIATDKPSYRPGEAIHLRTVALGHEDARPLAGASVTFAVYDPRGDRVCTGLATTSAYGIADVACELAERIRVGTYEVSVTVDERTVARTVAVGPTALPGLSAALEVDQPYALLGERVTGKAVVRDLLDRPVVGARVVVSGTADAAGAEPVLVIEGRTDQEGTLPLSFDLSSELVPGVGKSLARSFLLLSAQIASQEHGVGTAQALLPVSAQPILIEALPESGLLNGGELKAGMENAIHLRTLYPDGRPADCALSFDAPGLAGAQGATDAAGQAELLYQPPAAQTIMLTVVARDAQGQEGRRQFTVAIDSHERQLLLRPERLSYRAGEWMHLDVFAPGAGPSVYLDLIRDGRTVGTHAAELVAGRASFEVQAPHGARGVLELHAYVLLPDRTALRDVRQVAVDPAQSLEVSVRADREQYAPGDRARLWWQVTDGEGTPVQGVLGVVAVEEPPSAEPGGISLANQSTWAAAPDWGSISDLDPQHADVVSRPRPMPEWVKARFDRVETALAERRQAFGLLAQRLIWALAGGALLLWAVVLVGAYADAGARPTPAAVGKAVLVGAVLLPLLLGASALLSYLGRRLFGPGAVVALAGGWLGVLLALFVLGWTRGDGRAHLLLALAIGCLALTWGLGYALGQGDTVSRRSLYVGAASFGAALLAIYALAVRWTRHRAPTGVAAAGALIVLLLVTAFGMVPGSADAAGAQAARDAALETATPSPTATRALVIFASPEPQPTPSLRVSALPTPAWAQMPVGETVYWEPEVLSGPRGELEIEIPLPGAIGTWRVHGHASTEAGAQGQAETGLRTAQDLVVRPDLPAVLTMGDQLDLPIWIDNVLPVSQTVRITVTQASWFWVRKWGMDRQRLQVPPQGQGVLYLPIQVLEWGEHELELVVESDVFDGTVSRPVTVYPNGDRVTRVYSGWTDDRASYQFRVPWNAVRATELVTVKFYPGWASFLDEGLDGAQHMAADTFDQVAARARTNALWQQRLLGVGSLTPGRQASSVRQAALDYQRLLAFQSSQQGFTALGIAADDLYRSAYGVAALGEIAPLYAIDPASLDRAARWLLGRQADDGTWLPEVVPLAWAEGRGSLPRVDLPYTAYVAWALIEAGYADKPAVRLAVQHLERYLDQANDPYVLSLAIHALLAYGEHLDESSEGLRSALARLAEMAQVEEGAATWSSGLGTLRGATGDGADVECTALATQALLRGRAHPEVCVQGLAMLAANRDASGTWRSPQATFAALSAFSAALGRIEEPGISSTAYITVDGVAGAPVTLADRFGPAQVRSFGQLSKGYNDVEIEVRGDEVAYQVVGTYYLPWSHVSLPSPEEEDLSIEVAYDRTLANVGEVITVTVGLMANRPGVVPLTALELGLPPGLELLTADWDRLLEEGVIARYEQVGGAVKAYVANLSSEQAVSFRYRLRGRFPLLVQTLPSRAFDVANPERVAVREPVTIEIVAQE